MNITKTLIIFSILLVGQAHAMEPEPDNNPDGTRLAITSGDNTAIMDIQPEECIDQLPQGIIATGWYMWEHKEYVYPWFLAHRNYKNGKQKVAEGIVTPEEIEKIKEIEACAPAEGFASYKIAIDTRVNQFAQKHNLDEQDTTNLRRFTLSTYQTSLQFINSIQKFKEENDVNNIKTLLEGMRKNNNE